MILIRLARKSQGSLPLEDRPFLNIDPCRIGGPSPAIGRRRSAGSLLARGLALQQGGIFVRGVSAQQSFIEPHPGDELGRWPANLILTGTATDITLPGIQAGMMWRCWP